MAEAAKTAAAANEANFAARMAKRVLKLYYVQYTDENGENQDMFVWAFGPAEALNLYLDERYQGDLYDDELAIVSNDMKVREIDTGRPAAPMVMTWPEPIEL